jgi:choline kinase
VTQEEAKRVIRIGRDLHHDQAQGEFIGIMMASSKGWMDVDSFKDYQKAWAEIP